MLSSRRRYFDWSKSLSWRRYVMEVIFIFIKPSWWWWHHFPYSVEQYPVPNGIFSTPRAHQAPPTVSAAPTPLATTNQPQQTTPTPSTGSTQPKKTKVTKAEKKKDGGSSSTPTPGPVDVSRLDMRVGRIVKAWKHPDADGLYVEEGEKCCSSHGLQVMLGLWVPVGEGCGCIAIDDVHLWITCDMHMDDMWHACGYVWRVN